MALTLTTEPTEEPITLAEAKAHCRITSTDEDTLLLSYITAARQYVENFTRRALLTQTWAWRFDDFRRWQLEVPYAPLQSVSSIQYVDGNGDTQTLATSEYQVDSATHPARIQPAYGKTWPVTRPQLNAVTITFVAGYGDHADSVPMPMRQAMLLIIGELDQRREHAIAGAPITEVPLSATRLLLPYVVHGFGG